MSTPSGPAPDRPGDRPVDRPGDQSGDDATRAFAAPASERPAESTSQRREPGAHEAGTRDDWPTTAGGQTYVADGGAADEPRRRRQGGSHLLGTLFSLGAVLAALLLLDWSVARGWPGEETSNALPPTEAWVTMAVAAGLLLVVALLARASGPGTLLAGIVWGALPTVALVLRPARTAEVLRDLPQPWDGFGDGLLAATAVFPVLGALLIGIGLAGRWRARKPVDEV